MAQRHAANIRTTYEIHSRSIGGIGLLSTCFHRENRSEKTICEAEMSHI